jgi:hypothetical protein
VADHPVHYTGPNSRRIPNGYPLCSSIFRRAEHGTTDPAAVTCKRCIASMRADGLVPRG